MMIGSGSGLGFQGALGEINLLPAVFTDMRFVKFIRKNFLLEAAVWAFTAKGA